MKYHAENAVSSFFYYMWNAWSKEECKIVFGGMYKHFWEKWNLSSTYKCNFLGADNKQ